MCEAKGCVTRRDVSHGWTVWSDALLQPRGRTPVTHTAIAPRSMSLHGADNAGARLAAQRTAGLSASGSKHNIFTVIVSVINPQCFSLLTGQNNKSEGSKDKEKKNFERNEIRKS